MSTLSEDRLGISAVLGNKVELRSHWTEDDLQTVFRAAYEHVFGREGVSLKGAFAGLESQLRDGKINVRQFVQGLAKSEFYKEKFFYNNSQVRCIELNYKHLLGRAPQDQSEISSHLDLYISKGYDADIDSYIYSEEYDRAFGDNTVPYYRGFQSFPGMKTVGFNRLFEIYRGNGNSDNSQFGGKNSRLRTRVAGNLSNSIRPISTNIRVSSLTSGGKNLQGVLCSEENRVYRVEVTSGGKGATAARRAQRVYVVPFDRLSTIYQEVHKTGGKILSITTA